MDNLFSPSASVKSERILYTPTSFAKTSLLHLQEVGTLYAVKPHTSSRSNLASFLCFAVREGEGELVYEEEHFRLKVGDCVFLNCEKAYSHSTGEHLWALSWCHFYSQLMPEIYEKYRERGGRPVFRPQNPEKFVNVLQELYNLAKSADYIRDMRINEELNRLLTLLMEESWHPENGEISGKKKEIIAVREYLNEHFSEKISLDELAALFFINKFYLTKIFKETQGITISGYILEKRITRAKQLLRFSDRTIEEIGGMVGMPEPDYFSRTFKKVEGISPREYRKQW